MANTLTNLIPTLYEALDVVSRELVGFIPAVNRDSNVERAAKDQSVRVPIVPEATAADITPGVTAPDTGDQAIGNVEITISKARQVPVRWNGEETRGLETAGTYQNITRDRFAQAFRTLVNEIEADVASLYSSASRAYGTAATAPFGTANELDDAAEVRRILDDNGAPQNDLQLVLGSAAIANLRGKQSVLFKVNEAGTDDMLRRGIVGMLHGFEIHNSAKVKAHTKGTGAGYLADLVAGYGVGDTTVHVDTGTGTVLAGDVVTWAGDTNKYVINTGFAGDGDGDIVLAEPGLKVALDNDDALTVGGSYTANMAFHRGAIALATRLPALPEGGDAADDRMTMTDPVSGLSFEVSIYRQYRQVHYEVGIAWGYQAIKPQHMAILLG